MRGIDAETASQRMLRHGADPGQRREILQLVRACRIFSEKALTLVPDSIDGFGLRRVAKTYARRGAEAQRAHAALERATTDGRRHAGMADRLDHMLGELVSRFRRYR